MNDIRLILADDHQLVLDGLESLLSSRYEIIARVTDGRALVEKAQQLRPDVIVSDVSMPHEDGLTASRRILEVLPETRILLVTMNDDPIIASEALKAGARGYVLKSEASRELFTAIETVVAGDTYVSPALASASAKSPPSTPGAASPSGGAPNPPVNLTERQVEVLRLLGDGQTMKQVAAELHISPRTVAFHKYRIMEQLGIETNAELIRCALAIDLTRP